MTTGPFVVLKSLLTAADVPGDPTGSEVVWQSVKLYEGGRIDPEVTAVGLIELSNPELQRLVSSAVVQAAGVVLGGERFPEIFRRPV